MLSSCTVLVSGTTRQPCNHHLPCSYLSMVRCSGCGTSICPGHWQHHYLTCNYLAQGKHVSPYSYLTPPPLHVRDRELPSVLWRDAICNGPSQRSRCGKQFTKKTGRAKCPSCTVQNRLYKWNQGPHKLQNTFGDSNMPTKLKQAAQGTYVPAARNWGQGRHDQTDQ